MIEAHLKKLRARDDISTEEEEALRTMVSQVVDVPQDRTVIRHGDDLPHSTLLISGWLARVKDLPGGERQITELHVAGDFADLHAFTLKRLDHDLATLSQCEIAVVPHSRVAALTERFPRLARLFWFSTNVDASITRELA